MNSILSPPTRRSVRRAHECTGRLSGRAAPWSRQLWGRFLALFLFLRSIISTATRRLCRPPPKGGGESVPLSQSFQRLCLAAISICAFAATTIAQTIVYVDRSATDMPEDGTSWCTAFRDLQPVLTAAAPNTEIRVADGRYKPASSARTVSFNLKSSVAVYGGYSGCGAADPDARDFALYETILTGDLSGNDLPDFGNRTENSYNVVRGERGRRHRPSRRLHHIRRQRQRSESPGSRWRNPQLSDFESRHLSQSCYSRQFRRSFRAPHHPDNHARRRGHL